VEIPGESQYYLCTEATRAPGGAAQAFSLWLTEVCKRAAQWPCGPQASQE